MYRDALSKKNCIRNYFGHLIRVPYCLVLIFLILDVFRVVHFFDD